jgi:hypothetical protein
MEVSSQLHAPAALPPRKRAPGTHWIGGWVGPTAVLDAVVKRKIPSPRRQSNPRTPINNNYNRMWVKCERIYHHHHHHHHSNYRPFTACSDSEFNFWTLWIFWIVGRTPWMGDQPDARPLPTQDNTTQRRHTSIPRAGFELTIPVFERPKTVLALDRAATGTGWKDIYEK